MILSILALQCNTVASRAPGWRRVFVIHNGRHQMNVLS